VLARLPIVAERSLRGESAREIAADLGLHPWTIHQDREHIRELAQEKPLGSLAETVGRLRWVMESAEKAFIDTDARSLNRSAYLGQYRQAAMDEAKLLGQEPRQRVEVEATIRNGDLDIDGEIDRILARRLAVPRLVVEAAPPLEAPGTA